MTTWGEVCPTPSPCNSTIVSKDSGHCVMHLSMIRDMEPVPINLSKLPSIPGLRSSPVHNSITISEFANSVKVDSFILKGCDR